MANRYWINTAGGNWSDTANWSTTSGGTGGASVPTSVDDVFINLAGTYTVTLDVAANCLSLDFTGSNTVTLARGTNTLNVYGNLINTTSTTQSGSSAIYMKSAGICSIDTKGKTLGSGSFYIDGVGTFNLISAFNSSSCDIYIRNGIFNTNNNDITCWLLSISSSNTRTVNLGSSIINISTDFIATTTTGLTFNAGTSTIKINGSTAYTSSLGNLTYYNFEINNTNHTISGSNTFNTLKIYAGKTLKLTSATTQTVTNLDALGTSGSIITIASTTAGSPATISKVSGTVTVDYCSIQDITVTGGATFNATNSTNVSGNTGWNFNGVVNNPPSIPSGLSSSNITTSGFRLSWGASTDAESDTPITYKVYKAGTLYQSGVTANYLDITGQTSGSTANWTVSSVDSGGRESAQSSALSVTITNATNNAPTFKTSESPTIKTNSITNTSATIQFDMSDSENDTITVKVATKTTDSFVDSDYIIVTPIWNSSSDKWEVTISGLTPNTQYYTRIRIEDATHTGSSGTISASVSYLTTNTTLAPHGTLIYLYKDDYNYLRLFYSSTDNRFIIEKNVNGSIRTIGSPVVSVTAGQSIFYSVKQTPTGLICHTGVNGVLTKWGDI